MTSVRGDGDVLMLELMLRQHAQQAPDTRAPVPYPLSRAGVSGGLRCHWEPQDEGAYASCVPSALVGDEDLVKVRLNRSTRASVSAARKALNESPPWSGLPAEVVTALRMVEAICSSRIENLSSPVTEVAAATASAAPLTTSEAVAANYRMLIPHTETAAATSQTGWVEGVLDRHAILLATNPLLCPGQLREKTVWIGGLWSTPRTAVFNPPHPTRLAAAMADLGRYVDATRDIGDTIVAASLAHAQFETIHPFLDGNGRVGRALISQVLFPHAPHTVWPISPWLSLNRSAYYAALGEFRRGDLNPMVTLIADAVVHGSGLVDRLVATAQRVRTASAPTGIGGADGRSPASRLLQVIGERPAWTAAMAAERLEVSTGAARAALRALTAGSGPVTAVPGTRRPQVWLVDSVVDLVVDAAATAR